MEKYRESTLDLLFEKTKTTMPRGAPASLSDKAYVDIVSYLLKVNEFPAGAEELRVEDLPKIQLIGKGGPEPVPDFSLVRVVGCLDTNASDGAWMLLNSTDPVRTGNPQPAAGEPEAAEVLAAWSRDLPPSRVGRVQARHAQAAQGRSERISHPPAGRDPPEHHVARNARSFLRRVVGLRVFVLLRGLRSHSCSRLRLWRLLAGPADAPFAVRRGSRRRERDRIPGRRHPRLRHRQRAQVRQAHPDVAGARRAAARARARHCSERERPAPVRQHRQAACRVRPGDARKSSGRRPTTATVAIASRCLPTARRSTRPRLARRSGTSSMLPTARCWRRST